MCDSSASAIEPGDHRTLKGEATKARLLAEAMRLFAEHGYEGVSTRALAAAASSNVALITFHFGSKSGLYEAVQEVLKRRLTDVLEPVRLQLGKALALPGATPAMLHALLAAQTREILERLLEHPPTPGFFQLLYRETGEQSPLFSRSYGPLFRPTLALLEELLVAASAPFQRSRARMAAFWLLESILAVVRDYSVFRHHQAESADPRQDAPLLARMLCGGLEHVFSPAAEREVRRAAPGSDAEDATSFCGERGSVPAS